MIILKILGTNTQGLVTWVNLCTTVVINSDIQKTLSLFEETQKISYKSLCPTKNDHETLKFDKFSAMSACVTYYHALLKQI